MQSIKRELQLQTSVIEAALCSNEITSASIGIDGWDWDGRAEDFKPSLAVMGVDANYMRTLELELLEGRWFEDGSTDETNVVLNEKAIRELNIKEPYIGQRFTGANGNGRIIGVVKDFHYKSLHKKIEPLILTGIFYNMITFKTQVGQSAQAIQAAKKIWTEFFPNDPFEYSFLDDSFNNLYRSDIKTSRLMLLFSVLAIVIALLGLLGLSTFAVERRTKEIGIRKILGAGVSDIVNMLSKEFLILVCIAGLIAFPLAYYLSDRILQGYAYRISIGWWIFTLAGVITLSLTLLIVGRQAFKAATANPVKAIMNGE
jgi:ABC-type antimicrobial peptide transport system permease subunit